MKRTDDFSELELRSSYRDYSTRVSSFEEWQRVRNMIKHIPQDTTFDKDALDKGMESGNSVPVQITVRAQEYFKQWIGRVIEIEDSENFVAKIELLKERGRDQKIVRFNRHKVTIANLDR